jgi:hypothetical protein
MRLSRTPVLPAASARRIGWPVLSLRVVLWLKIMGFADGVDLPQMMSSVDHVEPAPAVNGKRTEDHVRGARLRGAE